MAKRTVDEVEKVVKKHLTSAKVALAILGKEFLEKEDQESAKMAAFGIQTIEVLETNMFKTINELE